MIVRIRFKRTGYSDKFPISEIRDLQHEWVNHWQAGYSRSLEQPPQVECNLNLTVGPSARTEPEECLIVDLPRTSPFMVCLRTNIICAVLRACRYTNITPEFNFSLEDHPDWLAEFCTRRPGLVFTFDGVTVETFHRTLIHHLTEEDGGCDGVGGFTVGTVHMPPGVKELGVVAIDKPLAKGVSAQNFYAGMHRLVTETPWLQYVSVRHQHPQTCSFSAQRWFGLGEVVSAARALSSELYLRG